MKRILAVLLIAVLLLILMCGCNGREIPLGEFGEKILLGQLDRFEEDGNDAQWAVISIGEEPYSVSLPANAEINSETVGPGAWINVFFDGDYPYRMCLAVVV